MSPKYPIPLRIREYKITDKGVEVLVLMSNFKETQFTLNALATLDSKLVKEFLRENPALEKHYTKNKRNQSSKK